MIDKYMNTICAMYSDCLIITRLYNTYRNIVHLMLQDFLYSSFSFQLTSPSAQFPGTS